MCFRASEADVTDPQSGEPTRLRLDAREFAASHGELAQRFSEVRRRRRMRRVVPRAISAIVMMVAAVAALAGCGDSGGADDGATATASTSGSKPRFVMVAHAPRTDPYWAVVAEGMDRAARAMGVTAEYRGVKFNLQDPNEERRAIESAIATKPDGLIVTDPFPRSLNPAIDKAAAAGIPVAIIETSIGDIPETDAVTNISLDLEQLGINGGKGMKELGARHPLFVTVPPGVAPTFDHETNGFIRGFGPGVEKAEIPLDKVNDSLYVKNAVAAKLTKDSSIDAVFSLGSTLSPPIIEVQKDLGSRADKMHWGSNGLGEPVVAAMQDGRWDLAVDIQQYNLGYLSVTYLALLKKYAIAPPPVVPVGTGIVTPDNVEQFAALQEQHVR
jgi:simple sugar transport system substrate-binding protein